MLFQRAKEDFFLLWLPVVHNRLTFKMAVADGVSNNCVIFQNTAKHYKTTTAQYHRFIPSVPQEFDCRVKANIKPESKQKDLKIRDEEFKTLYSTEYPFKTYLSEHHYRPPKYYNLNYIRNVEEKMFAEPSRPIPEPLSEMKEKFQLKYAQLFMEDIKPPLQATRCYLSRQGCEQQPAVPPHRKGFWRWTDPYLTMYKSQFGTHDEVDDAIKAETLTFYNESKFDLPAVSGNKTLFDKAVFKNVLPGRLQSRAQPRVPNFGMQSEYEGNYIKQTFSNAHPYLHESCAEFEDPLPPASRWQTMQAPGMYCSEYCNIGRKSVRCTIDQSPPKNETVRTKNCCRLY